MVLLYSTGKTTGLSVEVSPRSTKIAPAYQGYILPHAVLRLDVGIPEISGYHEEALVQETVRGGH